MECIYKGTFRLSFVGRFEWSVVVNYIVAS